MLLCPSCMIELKIADRQGVEIDYCPQCRGVWLDRGELDKIIDRTIELAPPRRDESERERWDDRPKARRASKKRRYKSMLEELFDFD